MRDDLDPEVMRAILKAQGYDSPEPTPVSGIGDLKAGADSDLNTLSKSGAPGPQIPMANMPTYSGDDEAPRLPSSAPSSTDISPVVKQAIAKKYGYGADLDDNALKDSQVLGNHQRLFANIGQAASTIGGAIAGVKPDQSFYQNMQAQSDKPQQDVLSGRKAAIQSDQFKQEQQVHDAGSPQSQTLQSTLKRLYPGRFSDEDISNMNAADMDLVFKPLQLEEQVKSRRLQSQQTQDFRNSQLNERQDFRAHQQNLSKLKGDQTLRTLTDNANNLQNALSTIEKTGVVPKQAFEDLQNIVVSNMGVKGQGGVQERAARYAHSLGIDAAGLLQVVTGKPRDIGQDNPLFQYTKDLAQIEIGNMQKRIDQQIQKLTSGNASIYRRRPDLRSDLDEAVGFSKGAAPQSRGVSSQSPQAKPPVVQNGHTYNWNPETNKYE